jgi:YcxB-like protein
MPQPVLIRLEARDLVAASLLAVRRSTTYFLLVLAVGFAGYFASVSPYLTGYLQFVGLIVLAGVGGLLGGNFLIVRPLVWWNARKLFHESKVLQHPFEVSWNDKHVSFVATNWNETSAWSDFLKYREGQDYWLLYINSANFRIIPKRFFTDPAVRGDFERALSTNVARKF